MCGITMNSCHLAVVGATGLVGTKMLDVLKERQFPYTELTLLASKRSAGKQIEYNGKTYTIKELTKDSFENIDIAIFSAGGGTSLEYAPYAKEAGCVVIDNSSAWRMNPEVPLVVPEVNGDAALKHNGIIANPNCSTIQMVVALKPLHEKYNINRVVVSTYQSVTGSGVKAVEQLEKEIKGEKVDSPAYPHQIAYNALPHIDVFMEDGYTKEERKMIDETKKIMEDDSILVSPTTVRIPTGGGHSESLNIEFENEYDLEDIKPLLDNFDGITVQDNPSENLYPMPMTAHEKDDVFVGRIRRDHSVKNGLHLWVVSDNLRKGAATNAVQIAEYLVKHSN